MGRAQAEGLFDIPTSRLQNRESMNPRWPVTRWIWRFAVLAVGGPAIVASMASCAPHGSQDSDGDGIRDADDRCRGYNDNLDKAPMTKYLPGISTRDQCRHKAQ